MRAPCRIYASMKLRERTLPFTGQSPLIPTIERERDSDSINNFTVGAGMIIDRWERRPKSSG